jgi:hypothetical protein
MPTLYRTYAAGGGYLAPVFREYLFWFGGGYPDAESGGNSRRWLTAEQYIRFDAWRVRASTRAWERFLALPLHERLVVRAAAVRFTAVDLDGVLLRGTHLDAVTARLVREGMERAHGHLTGYNVEQEPWRSVWTVLHGSLAAGRRDFFHPRTVEGTYFREVFEHGVRWDWLRARKAGEAWTLPP